MSHYVFHLAMTPILEFQFKNLGSKQCKKLRRRFFKNLNLSRINHQKSLSKGTAVALLHLNRVLIAMSLQFSIAV